jgi:transposase
MMYSGRRYRKGMEEMGKTRHDYTDAFRAQMVALHLEGGKPMAQIAREYGISGSALNEWVRRHKATGSFRDVDNMTPEQLENRELRKENERLRMEVDLLKQAALILGRR